MIIEYYVYSIICNNRIESINKIRLEKIENVMSFEVKNEKKILLSN